MIHTLELFGGVGLPFKALNNLGIPAKVIDQVEIDPKAITLFLQWTYFIKLIQWRDGISIQIFLSMAHLTRFISITGQRLGADANSSTRSSMMRNTINIIRQLGKWLAKAWQEYQIDPNRTIVFWIPARTDTSYWYDYIFGKAEIEFLRGRLYFEDNGQKRDREPFPSAVVVYKAGDS